MCVYVCVKKHPYQRFCLWWFWKRGKRSSFLCAKMLSEYESYRVLSSTFLLLLNLLALLLGRADQIGRGAVWGSAFFLFFRHNINTISSLLRFHYYYCKFTTFLLSIHGTVFCSTITHPTITDYRKIVASFTVSPKIDYRLSHASSNFCPTLRHNCTAR